MSLDDLKAEVEKLSSKEQEIVKLAKKICSEAEKKEVENLNDLPYLHKIRLKKALDSFGKTNLSMKIKREGIHDL